ncbi:MAG: FAD-dependent oxidoreductase [Lishizhenia sp.]
MQNNNHTKWKPCPECKGKGRKRSRIRKKRSIAYEKEVFLFKKNGEIGTPPIPPIGQLSACLNCDGSGLLSADKFPEINSNYPHVAIIGGGIGGTALAVACLHRGIPFTLFERDQNFDARSQGYGLTLQQANKAMKGFGILGFEDGIVSQRHLVHTTEGEVLGEWGNKKWNRSEAKTSAVKSNIHVTRQNLRLRLLQQLSSETDIQWNHSFVKISNKTELIFDVNGAQKKYSADLIVGADGIRSSLRNLLLGERFSRLNYLNLIVILGICPLNLINQEKHSLLDGETVFQTVNGKERMYMMPFTRDTIMWQFSFKMHEKDAITLSKEGSEALKNKVLDLTKTWHAPIPEIITKTAVSKISGYPVYDREPLNSKDLSDFQNITLMGDAAHPMSPFKGQGANQALLDALSLAREITTGCRANHSWKKEGLRKNVLQLFEEEMFLRASKKVKDSAQAAQVLHTESVLQKGDKTRGRLKMKSE